MASINRGDNTGAFGQDFLRIYLNNPNDLYIQKAVFQINGELEKEYIEPKFPLRVNFTGAETELLHQVNMCKLALWDEAGRRRTADGKFTFFVKENRITSPDTPDYVYDDVEVKNLSNTAANNPIKIASKIDVDTRTTPLFAQNVIPFYQIVK